MILFEYRFPWNFSIQCEKDIQGILIHRSVWSREDMIMRTLRLKVKLRQGILIQGMSIYVVTFKNGTIQTGRSDTYFDLEENKSIDGLCLHTKYLIWPVSIFNAGIKTGFK